jgi:ribosomal protein S18 acetylase RimI-like enzyme
MAPAELTFRPFEDQARAGWLRSQRAAYIDERVRAGDTPAEAAANADNVLGQLWPGGRPAPGQLAGELLADHLGNPADPRPVGHLWVGPIGTEPTRWWVWDILIDEAHRSRGLGRQAMVLAEGLARDAGATSLGLNVFAGNSVARSLYESLGYEETALQMRKDL